MSACSWQGRLRTCAAGQDQTKQSRPEPSGRSALDSAIDLGRKVAPLAPRLVMMEYGDVNANGSMRSQQNGPRGAMRQRPDLVMNMPFAARPRVSSKPEEPFTTEEGAIASAIEKTIVNGVRRIEDHGDTARRSRGSGRAILATCTLPGRSGETGRRAGLKIP